MLHILNGGWGLGGFGGVFFALNGKLCKGDCFAKCALQKIFKIVISSHKQQERARIANKTKNSKQKKIANKKIAIVLHAEGWTFEHRDVGCGHMCLLFSYLFCIQWKIMIISETAEADCPIFFVERAKFEKHSLSF